MGARECLSRYLDVNCTDEELLLCIFPKNGTMTYLLATMGCFLAS